MKKTKKIIINFLMLVLCATSIAGCRSFVARDSLTVTFLDAQTGEKLASQIVEFDGRIEYPGELKRDGNIFKGWLTSKNGKLFDFNKKIKRDTAVFATFETLFPGSGTITDPYVLSTAEELIKFSKLSNEGYSVPYWQETYVYTGPTTGKDSDRLDSSDGGQDGLQEVRGEWLWETDYDILKNKYTVLAADIDLKNAEWQPIGGGNSWHDDKYFTGVFDGRGHVVSNFKITDPSRRVLDNPIVDSIAINVGFFSGNMGTIKNLGIENFNIDCNSGSEQCYEFFAGGLVGFNCGFVTNCYAVGELNITQNFNGIFSVGGLLGANLYKLIPLSTAENLIGGNIDDREHGVVTGDDDKIAVYGRTINCYTAVNINATSLVDSIYIGGLIGRVTGREKNCFTLGDVNVSVSATNSEFYLGRLFGDGGHNYTTNFTYTRQKLYLNGVPDWLTANVEEAEQKLRDYYEGNGNFDMPTNVELLLLPEVFNEKEFYTVGLEWSESVWDFSTLDVLSGKYPRLKS